MSARQNILEINEVSKNFSPRGAKLVSALYKVSFALKKGSISAFIGPDGAGKSTLLRIIAGLLSYDSGSIIFQGKDYSELKYEQQDLMAYMPQKFGLYGDLTVQENLDLYADLRGLRLDEREVRYKSLLGMTGLEPFRQRLAGNLSGGMKQKLGLICTIVRPPNLLLLDEPTVGVDPLSRRELWEIIGRLSAESAMTVLVSSSNMTEAEKCDEVLLLFKGSSLAKGKPKEIEKLSKNMAYLAKAAENDDSRSLQNRLLGFSKIFDAVPQSSFVRFLHQDLDEQESKELGHLLGGAKVERAKPRLEDSFMLLLHKVNEAEKISSDDQLDRQDSLRGGKNEGQAQDKKTEDFKEKKDGEKPDKPNDLKPDDPDDLKLDDLKPDALDNPDALKLGRKEKSLIKFLSESFESFFIKPTKGSKTQSLYPQEEKSSVAKDKLNWQVIKNADSVAKDKLNLQAIKTDSELPIIELKNISKFFGDFIAVNDVSFSVYKGEVFGLLGPNGAGKTTTFRMLCGLLPASKGELYVDGVDVRKARREARQHLGYLAQSFSLYSPLSVRENLDFFAGAYGLKGSLKRERIAEVVDEFFLKDRLGMAAGNLPGGYRQRLAMAVALLHKPAILFLDEPTSGADPLARRTFWKKIYNLSESGVTIIVTTHFMEEAEYCDRILIQDRGLKLALGTPEEIRSLVKAPTGEILSMEDAFIGIVNKFRLKGD